MSPRSIYHQQCIVNATWLISVRNAIVAIGHSVKGTIDFGLKIGYNQSEIRRAVIAGEACIYLDTYKARDRETEA